jgi:hypothetical protein
LHTMSTSMVVEDVFKYLEKRGVQIWFFIMVHVVF